MERKYEFESSTGYSENHQVLDDLRNDSREICLSYCGWEECSPGHGFGPNMRDSYVLHVVKTGKGKFAIDNVVYELSAGDVFVIPPDIEAWYQADLYEPWTYMWIGFRGLASQEYISNAGFSNALPVRKVERMDVLYGYIEEMLQAHQLTYADDLKRNGLLRMFFAELITQYRQKEPEGVVAHVYPASTYVMHAMGYLARNYDHKIRINEVADYIGINRSYLTISFKKMLGLSPQEYLVKLRMERAKFLLCRTDLRVNEIARQVGYTDSLAFSKFFKLHCGESPKEYRKKHSKFSLHTERNSSQP